MADTITPTGIPYDQSLATYGLSQDTWNSLSATQQAVVGVAYSAAKQLYGTNSSDVSVSKAIAYASTDPSIISKYADTLKLDTQQFNQTLSQIQTALNVSNSDNQRQFESDRKALAEASAAAGQAYSGFRGKAQENLAASENSIVTSSRAAAQKSLDDLTSAFESKYGSAATTPATAIFNSPFDTSTISLSGQSGGSGIGNNTSLFGNKAGGITGSQNTAKSQDIANLAGDVIKNSQTTPTTPISG